MLKDYGIDKDLFEGYCSTRMSETDPARLIALLEKQRHSGHHDDVSLRRVFGGLDKMIGRPLFGLDSLATDWQATRSPADSRCAHSRLLP